MSEEQKTDASKVAEEPIVGIEQEQLDKLRAQHNELWHIGSGNSLVIFKRPPRAAYKRFQSRIAGSSNASDEAETLLAEIAVYPTNTLGLNQLMDRFPGMAGRVANEANRIARDEEVATAKKISSDSTARGSR